MRKQLTEAMAVRLAPPTAGRTEIHDTIIPALALRVTANGARSYVVRGRVKGTNSPIRVTLGDARAVKLAEAREVASELLKMMRIGVDPREAAKAAEAEKKAAGLTFEALLDEWAALHLIHRSPGYAAEAVRAIRTGLPNLLKRPVNQITRTDAVNALDRVAKAGRTVTAARTVAYARSCFSWALKRDKVPSNPFARLPIAGAMNERERVLSDAEVELIWQAAGDLSYPFGPFYRMALLTLQRREEVAGMRWPEIDLEAALWRIPGSRMKNGRPHDVHLSGAALAILRELPRLAGTDLVFTTGRRRDGGTEPVPISGFSQGKRYLDAAIAEIAGTPLKNWRLHDFRRTGVTWLARHGFDSIVADKLLAHQPAKLRGVAGIYQRYDFARERAAALDAWGDFVSGRDVESAAELRASR